MWMKPLNVFLLVLCGVTLIGCMNKKAPLHQSLGKKSVHIAVLSNTPNKQTEAVSVIEGRLLENSLLSSAISQFKEKVDIKIVSRNHIQKIMEEQSFSLNGLTEKETNVLGQLLNADVLVIVSKVSIKSDDSSYTKKSFYFKETLKCMVRQGHAKMSVTALKVSNGEILISDNFDDVDKHDKCSQTNAVSSVPIKSKVELNALKGAAEKFSKQLKGLL